jgi:hypothetical protein
LRLNLQSQEKPRVEAPVAVTKKSAELMLRLFKPAAAKPAAAAAGSATLAIDLSGETVTINEDGAAQGAAAEVVVSLSPEEHIKQQYVSQPC